MGIQGLLPFLKQIHQPVNISDFKGCTVAVDAYCWLHKGAFSCAEKLAMGEKTEQYVYYCMKYVDNLLRKGLKPILVFDGCRLKSKEDVENARRARRELNKKKAAQFLREGKRNEAKECLQKCVDITPQMALNLMNVCRERGVDCIVAPYEADAQLAYLSQSGVAQLVVTEDSDLLLFGCEKVIFKMDFYGNGILIEKSRLNEVLAIQNSFYSFEKFRYMCILSGCDYIPSLPGIGLVKACKVLKIARQQDLRQLLKKLPTYLKMNLAVTDEYVEKFICANNTFLYQLAFDPLQRKMVPLTPYPPEIDPKQLDYAGQYLPQEQAYQIALGNVDVHTHKHIAFFDPKTFKPKTKETPQYRHQLSIWDPEYRIKTNGSPCKTIQTNASGDCQWTSSHGKTRMVRVDLPRQNLVHVKPQIKAELGSIPPAEENLLLSQYLTSGETPEDDDNVGLSQKENVSEMKVTQPKCADNENLEEKEEDEMKSLESPKKGKKRKTPSWLEETAIEETVEEDHEEPQNDQPELSPVFRQQRNKFAVSPAKKMGRFNLEVHALRVKSRYFGTSSTTSSTPALNSKNVSPSADKNFQLSKSNMKTSSSSPKSSLLTMFENVPTIPKAEKNDSRVCQSTKKSLTPPKSRLLSMFEKAPVKQNSEREEQRSFIKKDTAKPGLFKYFQAKGAVTDETSSNGTQSCNVKIETSPRSSASNLLNKDVPQTNMRSKLSAFSWSKSSPLTRHSVQQAPVSYTQTANISLSKETEPELNRESPVKSDDSSGFEEAPLERDSEKSTDSGISESSECRQSEPCGSQKKKLLKVQDKIIHLKRPQDKQKEKNPPRDTGQKWNKASKRSILADNDLEDDVIELKSYSYNDFIQGLQNTVRTEDSSQSSAPAICGQDQVKATAADTALSCSQRSSLGSIDSFCQDALPWSSQRSSVGSVNSPCLDSSQNMVDLTDPDKDNQSSQTSNLSMASRSSQKTAQSKGCRVSGLSRPKTKVKAGIKRSTNQPPAGQRSITDMISKYW